MNLLKNMWLRLSITFAALAISPFANAVTVDEPVSVPEPGTLALFGLGLASIILVKKFRK